MHFTRKVSGSWYMLTTVTNPHITKHDADAGNHGCVRWNVHLVERFFCSNKIKLLFIQLIISMQRRHQKLFCASWPVIFMHPISIMCHDSNFKFWKKMSSSAFFYALPHKILCAAEKNSILIRKFMNFKFFQKIFLQWILNRAQKCQEVNGENRF
jgi:hypothetical protein